MIQTPSQIHLNEGKDLIKQAVSPLGDVPTCSLNIPLGQILSSADVVWM